MNRYILPLALALLGGVVLASSCGPTRTCTATTCTGCCDTTGECRSGFDNSACGTRGGACGTCGLGQTCLSGACSITGSGAGTATGGGFGGTGGGSTAGGGTGGGVTPCNSTNCPGCCATGGQCFTGRSDGACGTNGASCVACALGQACTPLAVGGRCLSAGPGGGSAGGGSSGGGSATGGGSAGGSTGCSPQTCPNGCCTSTGSCQSPGTTARCGIGGSACMACPSRQTCVSGSCVVCAGCIDLQTGNCLTGTSPTLCGRNGDFCSNCTQQSRTCQSGTCLPPPPPCTAQNCATGCCDSMSGACIPRSSQTATLCGQGSAGALCVACSSGACNTSSGSCSTGGLDGGLPPFPDGGLGSFCVPGTPLSSCGPGDCCFPFMGLGVCATIGNPNLLGGTTCGVSRMDCNPMPCRTNQTCSASGFCQ